MKNNLILTLFWLILAGHAAYSLWQIGNLGGLLYLTALPLIALDTIESISLFSFNQSMMLLALSFVVTPIFRCLLLLWT